MEKDLVHKSALPPVLKPPASADKKRARKAKLEKLRQAKHVTIIQSHWRGAKARRDVKALVLKRNEKIDMLSMEDTSPVKREELESAGAASCPITTDEQKEDNIGEILPTDKLKDVAEWPEVTHDTFNSIGDGDLAWPNLVGENDEDVLAWVKKHRKVLVRAITWNMEAKKPPSVEEAQRHLLPLNRFHIVAIGTEECERSIAKSAVNPSKRAWEAYLREAMGPLYRPLKAHTLQAIHMMVFVHIAICPLVSDVHSAAVACGMGNRLGNKGGIGLSIKVANTRMVFVNTHLAAHQHDVSGRNTQIAKLYMELPYLLMKKSSSSDWTAVEPSGVVAGLAGEAEGGGEAVIYDNDDNHVDSDDDEEVVYRDLRKSVRGIRVDGATAPRPSDRTANGDLTPNLAEYADRLIFMGDMNYRINGNREIVDRLLSMNMLEVLMSNDQLTLSKMAKQIPLTLTEAPLQFRPTYKFDHGCDRYDTGKKQRIPSWTDRILFKAAGTRCLVYNSVMDLRSSDHRPVYASFCMDVDVDSVDRRNEKERASAAEAEFTSESQVCSIM